MGVLAGIQAFHLMVKGLVFVVVLGCSTAGNPGYGVVYSSPNPPNACPDSWTIKFWFPTEKMAGDTMTVLPDTLRLSEPPSVGSLTIKIGKSLLVAGTNCRNSALIFPRPSLALLSFALGGMVIKVSSEAS